MLVAVSQPPKAGKLMAIQIEMVAVVMAATSAVRPMILCNLGMRRLIPGENCSGASNMKIMPDPI